MNGIPVCLCRKTQNAPTWQVENTAREEAIFAYFGIKTTGFINVQDATINY